MQDLAYVLNLVREDPSFSMTDWDHNFKLFNELILLAQSDIPGFSELNNDITLLKHFSAKAELVARFKVLRAQDGLVLYRILNEKLDDLIDIRNIFAHLEANAISIHISRVSDIRKFEDFLLAVHKFSNYHIYDNMSYDFRILFLSLKRIECLNNSFTLSDWMRKYDEFNRLVSFLNIIALPTLSILNDKHPGISRTADLSDSIIMPKFLDTNGLLNTGLLNTSSDDFFTLYYETVFLKEKTSNFIKQFMVVFSRLYDFDTYNSAILAFDDFQKLVKELRFNIDFRAQTTRSMS